MNANLSALRTQMKTENLDAFIVYSADPHMSEYLPKQWQERKWISGFTGSAGFAVITQDKAGIWTDARYFVQANTELKDSGFQLFKQGQDDTPKYEEWLKTVLPNNSKIGFNLSVVAHSDYNKLKKAFKNTGFQLVHSEALQQAWTNRQQSAGDDYFIHPEKYAGQSTKDKIQELLSQLKKQEANATIVTALDEVAWLFNLRGNDVPCNPVFLSYAYLDEKNTILFANKEQVNAEVQSYLDDNSIQLKDYNSFNEFLQNIQNKKVLVDPNCNQSIFNTLQEANSIIEKASPIKLLKAIKNEAELEGFRRAMKHDAVAMLRFLYWLEKEGKFQDLSEYEIGKKLFEFRQENEDLVGPSFGSIVGYNGNGAIIHYSAKKGNSATVKPEGTILIDSGGQYFYGTTDITRTLPLGGSVTEEFKKDYTLVLQGMIDLTLAKFPKGTRGVQLDVLARLPLWQNGQDYGHGTGHGVGSFMNVHEGPQRIHTSLVDIPLMQGMVVSNEPGCYREDKHGIRIENLIAVQPDKTTEFGNFNQFETLTLCPIHTNCADLSLLNSNQKEWLNNYHAQVLSTVKPLLNDKEEIQYLEDLCKPID